MRSESWIKVEKYPLDNPQRWLHLESSLVHRLLCFSYRFLRHVKLADPFLSFAQLRIGELRENAENIYIVGD